MKLENYVTGKWTTGEGDGEILYDAVTDEPISSLSTKGLVFISIQQFHTI